MTFTQKTIAIQHTEISSLYYEMERTSEKNLCYYLFLLASR